MTKKIEDADRLTTQQQIVNSLDPRRQEDKHTAISVFLLACFFEVFCLLLLALSPLPALHLSNTPLSSAWPWTLQLSRCLQPAISFLSAVPFLHAILAPLLLGSTLLGLFALYLWAVLIVRHRHLSSSRRWLFLLLGCGLAFGLTLLLQPMLFSDDVFTYIFSGRILIIYGADPLNTAPIQFPQDPYLTWVISGKMTPNIYGPFWLCIASLLAWISSSPLMALLLFKGLALAAHLLNAILVWCIMGKIAPSRRLVGTMLYAWNPLALIELAGSGHSEGVLLTFLLLALWFYVQDQERQPALVYASFITFGLANSINLIGLLLAPLFAWFTVREERRVSRAFWSFCWRMLLLCIPILTFLLPFWRGPATFFAITSAIDMEHFVHAPVGLLAIPIRSFFLAFAHWTHLPGFLQPVQAADVSLRSSVTFIFALLYLRLFGLVRHAPTTIAGTRYSPDGDAAMLAPGVDTLLTAWTMAVFWCLILASGWFWPWYVLWMLWTIVLRRFDAYTLAVLILSGTALFIYPFVGFSRGPIATFQAALIFGVPLVCLIAAWGRQKYAERTALSYDR